LALIPSESLGKTILDDNWPEVFILILSYNCCEQVRRCLASLSQLNYDNATIIVIDNDSTDKIADVMRAEFPRIPFIQTGDNLGYTCGNNQGIKYSLVNDADYVLVLNPDTVVVAPEFLRELVIYNESNPRVGISGPRVFFRTNERVQNTILYAPGFWRNLSNWIKYRLLPDNFQLSKDEIRDAEVLNGVCLLLRAACLKEIGLFDENIFMYIEDADLDYRARQFGWSVKYLPVDSVIHEQKSIGYDMTSQVSFLLRRNSIYYLCKIGKRFDAWAYAGFSLGILLLRGFLTFNLPTFREYIRFCKRLVGAYYQVLLGNRFDESFGPPYA
jgi:GT2 family glycosyltransferase